MTVTATTRGTVATGRNDDGYAVETRMTRTTGTDGISETTMGHRDGGEGRTNLKLMTATAGTISMSTELGQEDER
jgi:hypothetical protein